MSVMSRFRSHAQRISRRHQGNGQRRAPIVLAHEGARSGLNVDDHRIQTGRAFLRNNRGDN